MSHRTEQLQSSLQRTVSQIIQAGLADPRIRGLISITHVRVTPDHSLAIIHISVLPEQYAEPSLQGLRHAARWIRTEAGKLIRTRQMPILDFRLDDGLKKEAQVLDAIRQAMRETGPDAPDSDAPAHSDAPTPQLHSPPPTPTEDHGT